jgi:hypothetical protein
MLRLFLVILFALLWPAVGLAERILPDGVRRGTLVSFDARSVEIGRKIYRLAPGVRVYNESNRTIRRSRLPLRAPVAFEVDSRGDITQLWLLTPDER